MRQYSTACHFLFLKYKLYYTCFTAFNIFIECLLRFWHNIHQIKDSGAYSFRPVHLFVCLSEAKTLTLAITFEW